MLDGQVGQQDALRQAQLRSRVDARLPARDDRIGGLCAAAALVTAPFVSGERTAGHRIVPRAPDAGCAKPIRTQEVTS
jgi:hypothetical protein